MTAQPDVFSQSRIPGSARAPRISVIIPVRNDPKRLKKCLQSLAQSTLTDFELIVTDDASTDDTASVAESMGARVIRLPRCSGAAAARNAAAELATAPILMFIDADVCVHPDTLAVAAATFDDPSVDAVFGSYDLDPGEPNLLSQYKNLAHRFYHQISSERATTFWTGCGAIRRDVFNEFKFDAEQFKRPSIEDIELGARLTRAGRKIVINKKLQAKHLKRWTLTGVIRSDLFDRAIPWTRVILREKQLPGDLNLSATQRIAAMLAALMTAIFFVACCFRPWLAVAPFAIAGAIALADNLSLRRQFSSTFRSIVGGLILIAAGIFVYYARLWSLATALPLLCIVLINIPFYRFFVRTRGWLFTAAVLPMHVAYYLYGLAGFAIGHGFHYWDSIDQLDRPRTRFRLYAMLTVGLYLIAWALILVRARHDHKTVDFAVGDATGYYIYLPSVVIDHDLQFDNQLATQFAVVDPLTSQAMQHNRWPTGIALSIAPAFLIAHALSIPLYHFTHLAWLAPNGYSILYFVFCVAWAQALGLLGMILIDKLLIERFNVPGRFIAAAVLTLWIGTNFAWYFVREPLLAHMIGAAWVIFSVYLIHRIERNAIEQKFVWWQLPLLAFVTSMALISRMTNAFIFPMFVYLLIVLIRQKLIVRCLKLAPIIALALTPLLIQVISTRLIMGHVVSTGVQGFGYEPQEGFYWLRPALLRSLFSSRHGLFFSTPSLLFAAWGLIWHFRRTGFRRDPLLSCFVLSALLLWYVNSAWYAWWFGTSVGNRGYVELAGLFVIGFAFGFQWLSGLPSQRRTFMLGALAFCFVVNFAVMGLKMTHLFNENKSLIPLEDQILKGRLERI